ncbi:MAG: cupin domain-containing protein [Anaerolineales bacterium]|nr:cupin domain-containing protein [Anaerolineales bacterium]MCA9931524.1 cupin domain-containing protein [Anaerolineales bacterium]
MIEKVNLAKKFALFSDFWNPKVVGELNDFHVKLVKVKGEFIWHHHDVEDELFLVVKGSLLMRMRDQNVTVNEGEFIIIPHGVEHQPVAHEECQLMLIEPKGTLNTGNVQDERSVTNLDTI